MSAGTTPFVRSKMKIIRLLFCVVAVLAVCLGPRLLVTTGLKQNEEGIANWIGGMLGMEGDENIYADDYYKNLNEKLRNARPTINSDFSLPPTNVASPQSKTNPFAN